MKHAGRREANRQRTGSRFPTSPPVIVETDPAAEDALRLLVDSVTPDLHEGNLVRAREIAKSHARADVQLKQLPERNVVRMRAAATLAELHFAHGDDSQARALLLPYAASPAVLLASDLTARQKLQLGEFFYTLFQPYKALEIGERIRATAGSDDRALGECSYYLGRFCLRANEHITASEHCMRGLEAFQRVALRSGADEVSLRWQTGRLLRVRGNALRWQGRLTEATAVLYLAAAILFHVPGSPTQSGDAFHMLGRLLRSRHPDRHYEALDVLGRAKELLKGHSLKLSRVLTELGRTRLAIGLSKLEEGTVGDAQGYFELAADDFAAALKETDVPLSEGARDLVWIRQRADVLIWQSWFHQEAGAFKDLRKAQRCAQEALAVIHEQAMPFITHETVDAHAQEALGLVPQSLAGRPEQVEAELALGHCALLDNSFTEARRQLESARHLADDLNVPRLSFHVYLCLALLECRSGRNLKAARALFDSAKRLKVDPQEVGQYLKSKESQVFASIQEVAAMSDSFSFSRDDLLQEPRAPEWSRLKAFMCRAEVWAVEVGIQAEGGSIARGAAKLGISPGAVRDIRTRYKRLEQNLPPLRKEPK